MALLLPIKRSPMDSSAEDVVMMEQKAPVVKKEAERNIYDLTARSTDGRSLTDPSSFNIMFPPKSYRRFLADNMSDQYSAMLKVGSIGRLAFDALDIVKCGHQLGYDGKCCQNTRLRNKNYCEEHCPKGWHPCAAFKWCGRMVSEENGYVHFCDNCFGIGQTCAMEGGCSSLPASPAGFCRPCMQQIWDRTIQRNLPLWPCSAMRAF